MKHFRLTQQALGERIGVTKGYLSVMMNDKEPISTKVLERLIKSFTGLNLHWLLTGEGDMFLEKKEVVLAAPEPGLLSGVMEPLPEYASGRKKIALEDVAGMLLSMQSELEELRGRVERLDEGMRRMREGKGEPQE